MRKGLLWINWAAITILGLVLLFGSVQAYLDFVRYGFSYEVVSIIEGVSTVKTVSLYMSMLSLMIITGVCIVLLIDTCLLSERNYLKREEPLDNFIEK